MHSPGRRHGLRVTGGALLLALVLALGLAAPSTSADPAPPLAAGFAKVDLTPAHGVPLAGYGSLLGRKSVGIHDRVYARAAWFDNGGTRLAIVSVDLVGISAKVHADVTKRVAETGMTDLLLAATHNHSGPGGLTDIPLWKPMVGPYDPELYEATVAKIAQAIRRAAKAAQPSTLALAHTRAPELVRNRRSKDGPVVDDLGALVVRDAKHTVRGILFHFAAHATLLSAKNLDISADWPGAACAAIERAHKDAVAVFLNGAMGDLSPRVPASDKPDLGAFAKMERYGDALGTKVLAAVGAASKTDDHRVEAHHKTVDGRTVMARLLGSDQGGLAVRKAYPLRVSVVRVGPVELCTVPGEPIARFNDLVGGGASRWVVSCAQDHVGYFADAKAFRANDYEAQMSFFGPHILLDLSQACEDDYANDWWDWKHLEPNETLRSTHLRASHEGIDAADMKGWAVGLQHGINARAEVQELLTAAEGAITQSMLDKGAGLLLRPFAVAMGLDVQDVAIPMLVRAARRLQAHIPQEYLNEMAGIAEGAGVPYDAILLENTFLTLAEQTNPAALLSLPARCTNVVAMNEATSMGQLIHASTLDWGMKDVLKDRTITLVVEPERGHPFVSITWPGMVGTLRAMGAQGLSITEESCAAKNDTRLEGMPVNILMRKVVQYGESLDDAVDMLRTGPGTCGYKITVASGPALDARTVEVTATKNHVRKPVNGLLFGCDPDAPEEAFVTPKDESIPANDKSSARRYPALGDLLQQAQGTLRRGLLSFAMSSTRGGILNDGTLLACAFEPQLLDFHVAIRDDVNHEEGELIWESHNLLELLSPKVRARYGTPVPVTEVGSFGVKDLEVKMAGITVKELSFPSPVPCGRAHCDQVTAQLWLPDDCQGVVIELPAWKERSLVGHRILAMALARKKIGMLVLPMPYQADRAAPGVSSGAWTLSENLARTRQVFVQALADIKRVSLWLETQGFPPAKQAIAGVSLGGHAAAIAFGTYPERFKAGVFMLAGANVHDAFLKPNPITGRIHQRLMAKGVTYEEAQAYVRAMDPMTSADPKRMADVLLIAADADKVIAPKNARALAEAYGGARTVWLKGGHYAILGGIGTVVSEMSDHLTNAFTAK